MSRDVDNILSSFANEMYNLDPKVQHGHLSLAVSRHPSSKKLCVDTTLPSLTNEVKSVLETKPTRIKVITAEQKLLKELTTKKKELAAKRALSRKPTEEMKEV
jgi:hypothetical protein